MDLGKFITGAIVGGTIGAMGAMYAFTSKRERKMMVKRGRRMATQTADKINRFM